MLKTTESATTRIVLLAGFVFVSLFQFFSQSIRLLVDHLITNQQYAITAATAICEYLSRDRTKKCTVILLPEVIAALYT